MLFIRNRRHDTITPTGLPCHREPSIVLMSMLRVLPCEYYSIQLIQVLPWEYYSIQLIQVLPCEYYYTSITLRVLPCQYYCTSIAPQVSKRCHQLTGELRQRLKINYSNDPFDGRCSCQTQTNFACYFYSWDKCHAFII